MKHAYTASKAIIICLLSVLFHQSLQAQPTITSFMPTSGSVGTLVTITGTNFNTTAANNAVFFGACKADVTTATSTTLTVTVPPGATFAPITVLNTITTLAVYSNLPFNPTFSPNKGSFASNDLEAKVDFTTGANPCTVAIGDINGDGKPDLAITNLTNNTVSILQNTSSIGSVSFAPKVDFATANGPQPLVIGDIDGDSKLDLIIGNILASNTISVLRNISSGGIINLAPKVDFTTGLTPSDIAIRDVDGDGKPDLAVANQGSNTVSIFRNTSSTGSINFAAKVDFITGIQPISVAIGDIDSDDKPDLEIANLNSNSVSVLRNTSSIGIINFAAKVDVTTGLQPISVAICDIDGDGKPDLATANNKDSSVSILRNTSAFSTINFETKLDFRTGSLPLWVVFGDIDGDGKPDLATANYSSNTTSLLRNTSSVSTVNFAAKVDFETGISPYWVAIGDIDGDGKSDLVVTNQTSRSVSVYRNNPQISLPVTYTSFTATKQSNSVLLNWQTVNEVNNAYFTIQHSINGTSWANIGNVNAGNGNYSYLHTTPATGTNYYRLQQVDKDGKSSVSEVRSVNFSIANGKLSIYPNPTIGSNMVIDVAKDISKPISYNIYNALGVLVQQGTISQRQQTITIGSLSNGLYLLRLSDGQTASFIKQ